MPSPIEVIPILVLIVVLAMAINEMMGDRSHHDRD